MTDKGKNNIVAVILSGGKSSRFGSDKARADIHGIPLIVQLAAVLRGSGLEPQAQADIKNKYADMGIATHADDLPHEGPLGGIYSAFARTGAEAILFLSCDMPGVNEVLVGKILDVHAQKNTPVFCARGGEIQPFPAIYRREVLPLIEAARQCGQMAVQKIIAQIESKNILIHESESLFFNMNSLADQQEYKKKAGYHVNAGNV